jgi:predicted transglutaminase-like cysteine proteinase
MAMKQILVASAALIIGLFGAQNAAATYTNGQNMQAENMVTFGNAKVPIGYRQFCASYADECGFSTQRPAAINLTNERMAELKEINDYVNKRVVPVTDQELYNVTEKWVFPTSGKGDCEDYVLMKRRILMDRGYPASSLLITVVRDQRGDGHAVLTVVTNKGDLVLDNQRARIVSWAKTGYFFIKRQSQHNPDLWVSLRDMRVARTGNGATAAN